MGCFSDCENLIIYGYAQPYIQEYARKNDLRFVVIKYGDNKGIMGDADNDCSVTMEDVVLLQRFIAELAVLPAERSSLADVNFDDMITMLDVTRMQKYIAKIITEF